MWGVALEAHLGHLGPAMPIGSAVASRGTAHSQATLRDAWTLPYDLVVDAVGKSPAAAAQEITDWLSTGPTPRAIRQIASS